MRERLSQSATQDDWPGEVLWLSRSQPKVGSPRPNAGEGLGVRGIPAV